MDHFWAGAARDRDTRYSLDIEDMRSQEHSLDMLDSPDNQGRLDFLDRWHWVDSLDNLMLVEAVEDMESLEHKGDMLALGVNSLETEDREGWRAGIVVPVMDWLARDD